MLYQLSYFRKNKPHQSSFLCPQETLQPQPVRQVGRDGFEPPKAYASRFTVCPIWPLWYLPNIFNNLVKFEPMEGFEPTTPRLQITCSGQLSYIGINRLRDAKVGIIFNSANFLRIFFQKSSFLQFLSPTPLVQRTTIYRLLCLCRKIECKYNYSFPN